MAKGNGKTRLQDNDWKSLFPGEDYKIGSTTLRLEPLSLKGLSIIVDRVSSIIGVIQEKNVDLEQLGRGDNTSKIIDIVHLIVTEAPEILSEMSGLHSDDIQGLPLEIAVDLFNKCLEVNVTSQDNLRKNFQILGTRLSQFLNVGASEASSSIL